MPLFILLKWLHGLIGNWGWAIIVMTIMIKGAFYPLNAAAARSMAKMKIIAPKMKAMQEQYANDKQQLQIKMMEMYKTEKINPLGGCLPILVQIPVFIALYWVLLSAVELRQAPWILWIHDLSAPDPYFVLPVIYAITAYLQVKLSPTPITDPVQAKVMQIMPIAFSVLFIFFPSGLVLYWLVNNVLQIAQQWHMNRLLEREAAAKAATAKVGRAQPRTLRAGQCRAAHSGSVALRRLLAVLGLVGGGVHVAPPPVRAPRAPRHLVGKRGAVRDARVLERGEHFAHRAIGRRVGRASARRSTRPTTLPSARRTDSSCGRGAMRRATRR